MPATVFGGLSLRSESALRNDETRKRGAELSAVSCAGEDGLFFEVETPIEFHVRVTRAYWELIVTVKQPVMAGREVGVQAALTNPDEIRLSRSDPNVYLFYKSESLKRRICAVVKRMNGDGFLITTYPAGAIKEGERGRLG